MHRYPCQQFYILVPDFAIGFPKTIFAGKKVKKNKNLAQPLFEPKALDKTQLKNVYVNVLNPNVGIIPG